MRQLSSISGPSSRLTASGLSAAETQRLSGSLREKFGSGRLGLGVPPSRSSSSAASALRGEEGGQALRSMHSMRPLSPIRESSIASVTSDSPLLSSLPGRSSSPPSPPGSPSKQLRGQSGQIPCSLGAVSGQAERQGGWLARLVGRLDRPLLRRQGQAPGGLSRVSPDSSSSAPSSSFFSHTQPGALSPRGSSYSGPSFVPSLSLRQKYGGSAAASPRSASATASAASSPGAAAAAAAGRRNPFSPEVREAGAEAGAGRGEQLMRQAEAHLRRMRVVGDEAEVHHEARMVSSCIIA